jgi:plastocyanin
MTLSLRRRPALVVAGVVASAPLWLAIAAHAAHPANQVVTFSGTPDVTESTVSCPSTPNKTTLTVSPGDTVDFVNELGVAATLTSSSSHRDLDDGEMVPVTFSAAAGKVSLEMLPHCPLDVGVHVALIVTVLVPGGEPSASASASAPASSPPATPSASPGGSRAPTPPKHSGPKKQPPKHRVTATPSRSPLIPGAGNGGDADPRGPSVAAEPTNAVLFGDPISATPAPRGASGLLTLIATVSVGGVTAAVIRAIVAHRATRSLIG